MPEFDGPISMFDVEKIPDVIERCAQATLEQLPHIKRLLAGSYLNFIIITQSILIGNSSSCPGCSRQKLARNFCMYQ